MIQLAPHTHCLIIAAHPDDEVLGAGGFMAHHPGCSVAIVSEGTSSERVLADDDESYHEFLMRKHLALQTSCQILKSIVVRQGEYADQQLVVSRSLQLWIESVIEENRPEVVLTHLPTELNRDHQAVGEATLVACRPYCQTGQTVKLVLGFSVDPMTRLGMASQPGQLFVPLSEEELSDKLLACRAYEAAGAMRDWPHPRSIQAIEAAARVTGSRLGVPAAEAFTLLWGQLA